MAHSDARWFAFNRKVKLPAAAGGASGHWSTPCSKSNIPMDDCSGIAPKVSESSSASNKLWLTLGGASWAYAHPSTVRCIFEENHTIGTRSCDVDLRARTFLAALLAHPIHFSIDVLLLTHDATPARGNGWPSESILSSLDPV
jgi:hypothetical protein